MVYKLDPEKITAENLTLDQWRPITEKQFVDLLSSCASYDGETYTGLEVRNVELPQGSGLVFYTCDGVESDNDVIKLTPELLVLEVWSEDSPLSNVRNIKRLCFCQN